MAQALIPSSSYVPLAHGALNWDGALRTDIQNLTAAANTLIGTIVTFGYAGTVKDWSASGGWATGVELAGNICTLEFGFDPGANGLTTASSGYLVGVLPASCKPTFQRIVRCQMGPTWNGSYTDLQINRDGSVVVVFISNNTTIGSGTLVTGGTSFRVN